MRSNNSRHATPVRTAVTAFVVVILMAAVVPMASDDSEAASDTWKCTITIDGTSIVTKYAKNGSALGDTTPVRGNNGSATTGSWGFDSDGYGPFGSYYAAFDVSTGKLAYRLDPDDLSKTVDGVGIEETKYEIMWVLPTVWMKVEDAKEDGSGSTLVMSSIKESDDMEAPAHTIDGVVYNYLALGVYEGFVSGSKVYSFPNQTPTVYTSVSDFQKYSRNTGVDGGYSMLWNFYQWQLYRFCSLAVMEDFDSQTQIGSGMSDWGKINTGSTTARGPYYGTTGYGGVKLFLENTWGNYHDAIGDAYWSRGLWAGQNSVQVTGKTTGLETIDVNVGMDGFGTAPYSTSLESWGLATRVTTEGSGTAPDRINTADNVWAVLVGGAWDCHDACGISYLSNGALGGYSGIASRLAFVFEADPQADVEYDHSALKELLEEYGYDTSLIDRLPTGKSINGQTSYDQLDDVPDETGFRHVGWIVDGKEYPADSRFVKRTDHTAKSVWVGLPAVTYDHSRLIDATGLTDSVEGLSNGMQIGGNERYEKLPDRVGYAHVGWLVGDVEVGPTDEFVTRQSHTAISLWSAIPMVVLDHHQLLDVIGDTSEGVAGLPLSLLIPENTGYPQLPDTAGYRHIGWRIGDAVVDPTAGFLSEETHTAVSLWEQIPEDDGFVPLPDDGRWDDAPYIPEQKESGWGWLGDSKNILVIAILAAIIAELAVLQISRKR